MRAFDWSRTPLGPTDRWPRDLRVAVDLMLCARARMAVYWGEDHVLLYNDAWRELIGDKHPHALGRPARDVFPEVWATIGPRLDRVRSTGEAVELRDERLPLDRHGHLEDAWFDLTFNPFPCDDGATGGILTIATETTQQIRAQQALQAEIARSRAVFEQMTEGLVVFDPAGNLLEMNPAALRKHGFDSDESLRHHVDRLAELFELYDLEGHPLPTRDWPIGRALRGETFDRYEVRIERSDGGPSWIGSYGGTPVYGPDGQLLLAIVTVRDVTALKTAEIRLEQEKRKTEALARTLEQQVAERTRVAEQRADQLQVLAFELSETEERERQRIAGILHDELQQLLSAARFQLTSLRRRLADPASAHSRIVQLDRLLDDSIQQSRQLSHELSPPLLHQSGLVAALDWCARNMETNHGLRVRVETHVFEPLADASLQVFLFRAAQEMLFNVVKHAGTNEAHVNVEACADHVQIEVSDHGHGFDPGRLDVPGTDGRGLGLFSLRERVDAIGGRLDVESAPGMGTRLVIRVPTSAR